MYQFVLFDNRADTNAVMYSTPQMNFSGVIWGAARMRDGLLEAHERSRSKIMKDRSGKVTITDYNGNVYEGESNGIRCQCVQLIHSVTVPFMELVR